MNGEDRRIYPETKLKKKINHHRASTESYYLHSVSESLTISKHFQQQNFILFQQNFFVFFKQTNIL